MNQEARQAELNRIRERNLAIEMIDQLYHDGFDFNAMVDLMTSDFEMSEDEACTFVSETLQAAS